MTTSGYGGDAVDRGIVTALTRPSATRRSELADATSAIIDELRSAYLDVLPTGLIAQYAGQAVTDLSGSICIEALPEMAIRLARFRLDAQVG